MLLLTMALFYSCSNDYYDDTSLENNTSQEIISDYDLVVQSREFQEYESNYSEFICTVSEITALMSDEEKKELVNLADLYRTDPSRFQSLFEYKIGIILGDDSVRIKESYSLLLESKENLLGKKNLKKKIEENEDLVFTKLQDGIIAINTPNLAPLIKTRGPETVDSDKLRKCKDICYDECQNKLKTLKRDYICTSAINITTCMLSGGTTGPFNFLTQIGLSTTCVVKVDEARDAYDICIRRCELDFG